MTACTLHIFLVILQIFLHSPDFFPWKHS